MGGAPPVQTRELVGLEKRPMCANSDFSWGRILTRAGYQSHATAGTKRIDEHCSSASSSCLERVSTLFLFATTADAWCLVLYGYDGTYVCNLMTSRELARTKDDL